jgi:UDP-glucose 4-epimerase
MNDDNNGAMQTPWASARGNGMPRNETPGKFLVTGGCGFIGLHLVGALMRAGHSVVVLDRNADAIASNSIADVTYICGSVSDEGAVAQAMNDCDGVYHLAAVSSVNQCDAAPEDCRTTNIEGSQIVFRMAHRTGEIPVVYASSAAIYGEASWPLSETHTPQPQNLYGQSKLLMEQGAQRAGLESGTPTFGLRLFNVFGPHLGAFPPGVIPAFVAQMRSGLPVTIYGDGLQQRDFVFVEDAVRHMLAAMWQAESSAPVANVCSGIGTTIASLISTISDVTGRQADIERLPRRGSDVRYSVGNPARVRDLLKIGPGMSLRDGIAAMLRVGRDVDRGRTMP